MTVIGGEKWKRSIKGKTCQEWWDSLTKEERLLFLSQYNFNKTAADMTWKEMGKHWQEIIIILSLPF